MRIALQSLWAAVAESWARFIIVIAANVMAMFLSLPILAGLVLVAALMRSLPLLAAGIVIGIAVLPNPACAGLQQIMYGVVHKEPLVGFGEYWQGLRDYGPTALKAWTGAAVITVLLGLNIYFYAVHHAAIFPLLEVLFTSVFIFWLGIHLFVYPLLMQQKEKRILLAYRNAMVMTVTRPLTVFIVLPFWLLVLVLTTGTGFIGLIGLGLGIAIQQQVTGRLVGTFAPATRVEAE